MRAPHINIWFIPANMDPGDCAEGRFYINGTFSSSNTYELEITLTDGLALYQHCSTGAYARKKLWSNMRGRDWYSRDYRVWACDTGSTNNTVTAILRQVRSDNSESVVATSTDSVTVSRPSPTPRPTTPPTAVPPVDYSCSGTTRTADETIAGIQPLIVKLPAVMNDGDCANIKVEMSSLDSIVDTPHRFKITGGYQRVGFEDNCPRDGTRDITHSGFTGTGTETFKKALYACDASSKGYATVQVVRIQRGVSLTTRDLDVIVDPISPSPRLGVTSWSSFWNSWLE